VSLGPRRSLFRDQRTSGEKLVSRRTWTVATLASAAELDVEETLLALWVGGIEYVSNPASKVRATDSKAAEAVTGVIGDRRRKIAYWQDALSMSRAEVGSLLGELGFKINSRASNLPKGAIRKLKDYQRLNQPELDPGTPNTPSAQPPAFEWRCVGQPRDVQELRSVDILAIHRELERDFAASDDPISPPGLRSEHLLESAVSRQAVGFGGARKYTSVVSTSAALLHSLVNNHPFHNGNKRTALVAMLVMLDANQMVLTSNEEELFRWMLKIAGHELLPAQYKYDDLADRETFAISEFLQINSRPVRREHRIVTWAGLQRILKELGCEISHLRGERVEISRPWSRKRRFWSDKNEVLRSTFMNTSNGRDVPRKQLKRIREELRLDEQHGYDSEAFFGNHKGADEFIAEYSKLLKRLARV